MKIFIDLLKINKKWMIMSSQNILAASKDDKESGIQFLGS